MMIKYEAMFIVKPDLPEEEKKTLFNQLHDTVAKHNGKVSAGSVWSERKKLFFPIKKYREGVYYLLNFSLNPLSVKDIRQAYALNENILRVLITNVN
jgi:small subunit ribosomal protein S6